MDDGLTWLRLPAEMSSLERFTAFARGGAQAASLPDAALHKLDLMLEEVLVNVFRYAYPEGQAGEAEVGYAAAPPDGLRIDVRDSGQEFNPLEKTDPNLDLGIDERPIGGLGIFLVKSLAESVSYRRENGRNILSFCLR
jgi:anti-sigma regulatory factor (Ser/Thr protein kinase)